MVIALPVSKGNSDTAGEKHLTASHTTQEQKSELEEKLENLLENAEGVGKVKVMLMEDGGQGVYSAGETEVTGVLIVAEGADNAVTVQKIQQAVMALFQIDAHNIRIMKMTREEKNEKSNQKKSGHYHLTGDIDRDSRLSELCRCGSGIW